MLFDKKAENIKEKTKKTRKKDGKIKYNVKFT